MSISKQPSIRKLLHDHPDGLSASEIADKLAIDDCTIRRALKGMADTYIDRWLAAKQGLPEQAIWCAIEVPEDCPRPT